MCISRCSKFYISTQRTLKLYMLKSLSFVIVPPRAKHKSGSFFCGLKAVASLAMLLLLFFSCGPAKDHMRFEGTLNGISDAEFYVYSEDGAFEGIDTVRITDGKFSYERALNRPAIFTLLYPNFSQSYIIAEPGKTIKLKGDASTIGEATLSGTEQNEKLSDFRKKHANDVATNQRLAAAQFVRDNAKSLAAVAVFRMYFANKENADPQTALQLLDVLRRAQPKESAVVSLDQFFRPIFLNGEGQPLPSFVAQTLDGRKVSSADYRGRKLVIAFTGSWQSDTRMLMKQLRRKLQSMNGKWACLVVSLDVDRNLLQSNLRSDSITYPVICDLKSFDSPLAKQLGVHYVPSLMLVNEQGRIVQRDVTQVPDARF